MAGIGVILGEPERPPFPVDSPLGCRELAFGICLTRPGLLGDGIAGSRYLYLHRRIATCYGPVTIYYAHILPMFSRQKRNSLSIQPCSVRRQRRGHDAAASRAVSDADTPLLLPQEQGPHAQTNAYRHSAARVIFSHSHSERIFRIRRARAQEFCKYK